VAQSPYQAASSLKILSFHLGLLNLSGFNLSIVYYLKNAMHDQKNLNGISGKYVVGMKIGLSDGLCYWQFWFLILKG
jgi:hypothetical protein